MSVILKVATPNTHILQGTYLTASKNHPYMTMTAVRLLQHAQAPRREGGEGGPKKAKVQPFEPQSY